MAQPCFLLAVLSLFSTIVQCDPYSPAKECDRKISDEWLAYRKSAGQSIASPVKDVAGKTVWRPSVIASVDLVSSTIDTSYGSLQHNVCPVNRTYYNSDGGLVRHENLPKFISKREDLDAVLAGLVATYSFACSKRLTADYRCAIPGNQNFSKYAINAPIDLYYCDIKDEVKECEKKIKAVDPAAVLTALQHPARLSQKITEC